MEYPDGRTLGFSPTSDGLSIIPDWNNRHFSLAEDSDDGSVFYHLTKEGGEDEKIAKEEHGSTEEWAYDLMGSLRGFNGPMPRNFLEHDCLLLLDLDKYADTLEDIGALERTDEKCSFNLTVINGFVTTLASHKELWADFLVEVCKKIPLKDAYGEEPCVFFTPDLSEVVLVRSDGYVLTKPTSSPENIFNGMSGSRTGDMLFRIADFH